MNTTLNPLSYPFCWPTGKLRLAQFAYDWRNGQQHTLGNGMMDLTIQRQRPHNALVLDASKTGRENPIQLRRTSAKSGRFFFARKPIMAAWLGHGSSMARTLTRVSHPPPSRHHNRRGGSIRLLRSHLMKSPYPSHTRTPPKFQPNHSQSPHRPSFSA
jgi:hypothetical protein